eukprot:12951604-Alexandrium_andersonii.AAC.1
MLARMASTTARSPRAEGRALSGARTAGSPTCTSRSTGLLWRTCSPSSQPVPWVTGGRLWKGTRLRFSTASIWSARAASASRTTEDRP